MVTFVYFLSQLILLVLWDVNDSPPFPGLRLCVVYNLSWAHILLAYRETTLVSIVFALPPSIVDSYSSHIIV